MKKQNCWEYMMCGRHPGGHSAAVCPVSVYEELNGVHGGKNAGRACWAIDNSLCPDLMRESSEKKFSGCWKCNFYHRVKNEERSSPHGFITTYREMKKIREKPAGPDGTTSNNASGVFTRVSRTGSSCGGEAPGNDTAKVLSSDSSCDQKS
jgi:hypothetical protein